MVFLVDKLNAIEDQLHSSIDWNGSVFNHFEHSHYQVPQGKAIFVCDVCCFTLLRFVLFKGFKTTTADGNMKQLFLCKKKFTEVMKSKAAFCTIRGKYIQPLDCVDFKQKHIFVFSQKELNNTCIDLFFSAVREKHYTLLKIDLFKVPFEHVTGQLKYAKYITVNVKDFTTFRYFTRLLQHIFKLIVI